MKKLLTAITFLVFSFPLIAVAALPNPTGLESVPPGAKYSPPCAQGDLMVGNSCVPRRFADVFRSEATMRRQERMENMTSTHRTQRQINRNLYLHPTGVRAARMYNGFELLEPNSRQHHVPMTQIQTNMRMMRAEDAKLGAAASRVDTSPRAMWTKRTKEENFWNPANLRVRRGLRM
ncbi:MAG TPA: hypothetical protein VJB60_00815 [Candidatus Peribacterales bacterium]|nr:hypothetical protein [Candidatus Peribacterales bacterium]